MESTSHMCLLSTWNVDNYNKKLKFSLYLILINSQLNLNNYTYLVLAFWPVQVQDILFLSDFKSA